MGLLDSGMFQLAATVSLALVVTWLTGSGM